MWVVSFLIYTAFIIFQYFAVKKNKDNEEGFGFIFVCTIALALRIIISALSKGYRTDINCFHAWAVAAANNMPWDFYESIWCDYPPGYLYVLGLIGIIKNTLPYMGETAFAVLLRLPACICDIAAGVFIYRFAKKHVPYAVACGAAAIYLLSPATMVNSAVWGQADSVFLLLLLITLCFLWEEKYFKSAALFGVCLTVKMQAIMFAPVFLYVLIDKYIKTKDKKLFVTFLWCVLLGVGTAALTSLPFATPRKLIQLYCGTTGQYPYASLNAFNLFAMLGKNTVRNSEAFLGLTFKAWGNIGIVFSVLISGAFYLKSKERGRLFYSAALLISMIYTLSSDMHERYLFPAMALFLVAAVSDGSFKTFLIYFALTLSQYVNVGYLYCMSQNEIYHFSRESLVLILGSVFTVAAVAYAVINGGWKKYETE